MNLNTIIEALNLEKMCKTQDGTIDITGVYIGDLLSLVMSKAKQGNIWLTIQTHINIVAVADLLDLAAILVVEGMEVDNETIVKAEELGLPILRTNISAYEAAKQLVKLEV
jgi:predicted transcriptional regulator